MPTASPEQLLFTSTAQAFLDKEASLARIRELHAQGTSFDPGWWQRAAELGWASLLVPEELGGGSVSGDGVSDLALVAQQIGRTVAPGPLHPVSTVLAGLADAPDGHDATIEGLISGGLVGSWAVYEPGLPWSPSDSAVTAAPDGDGFRLDGIKDRVEAGDTAEVLLVVARTATGIRQFLVHTDSPGVTVEPQRSVDLVKRYARVRLEGAEGTPVGSEEQTPALIDRQTQIARLLQCAEAVGIFDAVMDMTVQWAFDRHTFGRPLASYQALKHKFADMKLWLESCRATTKSAVVAVAQRSPDATLAVDVAKSYVGERVPMALQQCVQLHGGIGVTWEHDLHLYLRRAALYRSLYGTPEELNIEVYRRLTELEPAS